MQTILLLVLIGVAAGLLSGVVGIGGGIIIVPALVYILGFSQKMAQGTSLGVLLLPVGIVAVMQYYKQGHIDVRSVLYLAGGFIIGGYLGGKLSMNLPDAVIKKIFAGLLIVVAIKMVFFDKPKTKPAPATPTETSKQD